MRSMGTGSRRLRVWVTYWSDCGRFECGSMLAINLARSGKSLEYVKAQA